MNTDINGRIVKGIGGFYYVESSDSSELAECRARGVLRHQKIKPMVGDFVSISQDREGNMAIAKIEKRKNAFVRPPVANVDIAIIVFAAVDPEPNFLLLDKLLIASEEKQVEPIICITKTDIAERPVIDQIKEIYSQTPYTFIEMHDNDQEALNRLEACVSGKTSFLAGPSGVGKSTLANRLCSQASMETGALSQKLGRGRHTTRHVELLKLKTGGYLLDTPGFSSLQLNETITPEDLRYFFPEFEEGRCRFNTCLHHNEPDCYVKEQLENGKISKSRYENYIYLLKEMMNKRK